MPCYQMNLISVEFKAKHANLLEAAAKALGWAFSSSGRYVICGVVKIDLERQTARTDSYNRASVNRLKVEYSRQAVLLAAKKQKWFVKQQSTQKLELRRY